MLQRCPNSEESSSTSSLWDFSHLETPSTTAAALQQRATLYSLHYKADSFTSIGSTSPFFSSNVSEVKAVSAPHSICTYTDRVKESDAKTSECKHPLNKSGHRSMLNRKAVSRKAKSTKSTIISSIWGKYLTYPGYKRRLQNLLQREWCAVTPRSHQDLAHLHPGPFMIPPFQLLNLGVVNSSFHYEWKLLLESLGYLSLKRMQTGKPKYHFL